MDILEHVALTRFHAKWITLDTGAHPLEIRADGQQYEVRDQVGSSIGWYQSRGYRIYRVGRFLLPLIGDGGWG